MKITKEQLQQIIKEELEEEMGGGMPDKAEIEEVLDDVLQNIRKNALSDDIAKQGARVHEPKRSLTNLCALVILVVKTLPGPTAK